MMMLCAGRSKEHVFDIAREEASIAGCAAWSSCRGDNIQACFG
jgi:hypothetical protein